MKNPFSNHPLQYLGMIYDLLLKKKLKILDLGCGDARFITSLNNSNYDLHGADIESEKFIQATRKYSKRIKFKTLRPNEKLPYKDNYFDVVCFLHVLEHVPSEVESISEIHRVLKKGGQLYLASPYYGIFTWADTANLRFRFPRLHRFVYEKVSGKKAYKDKFLSNGVKLKGDCHESLDWHKHYKEKDIQELLGKKFVIEKLIKHTLFLPFLLLLQNISKYIFGNYNYFVNLLIKIDNKLPSGDMSYNFIAVAKKK